MSEGKLRAIISPGWVHLTDSLDAAQGGPTVMICITQAQQVIRLGRSVEILYQNQPNHGTIVFRTEEEAMQLIELLSRAIRREG